MLGVPVPDDVAAQIMEVELSDSVSDFVMNRTPTVTIWLKGNRLLKMPMAPDPESFAYALTRAVRQATEPLSALEAQLALSLMEREGTRNECHCCPPPGCIRPPDSYLNDATRCRYVGVTGVRCQCWAGSLQACEDCIAYDVVGDDVGQQIRGQFLLE